MAVDDGTGGLPSAGVIKVDCGTLDFGCKVEQGAQDALTNLAERAVASAADAMTSLATYWVNTTTPPVGDTDESGVTYAAPTVAFIRDSLYQYVILAAVLSVILAGGKMAWERREQPGLDLIKSLFTLILVSGASIAFIGIGVAAGDAFSVWIIARSTDDFGASVAELMALTDIDAADLAVLLLIVAGLGLIVALLQIVLLVVRGGFLILLAGVLPLAASFTNTDMGKQWLSKAAGWVIAFMLYKPAAAIIYATAFSLVGNAGNSGDPTITAVTGGALMVMSLVALPALLKFVTPLVGAAAGSGGGGMVAGVAGALATGAVASRIGAGAAARASTASGGGAPSGSGGTATGAGLGRGGGGSGPGASGGGNPSGGGPTGGGGTGSGSSGSGGSGTSGSGSGGSGTGGTGPGGANGRNGGSGATGGTGSTGSTGAPGSNPYMAAASAAASGAHNAATSQTDDEGGPDGSR